MVVGPLAGLLIGCLSISVSLISRPVPAFAQTPIPADAEVSLITDHQVPSDLATETLSDSTFERPECKWATDAEARVLAGPDVVRWGDGRSRCGYYGSRGEFLVYALPTWQTKDDVACPLGLLLAAGQGGCLKMIGRGQWSVSIRVDGHDVGVVALTIVDRHKLLGFANMVSARMKDQLGEID